MTPEGRVKALVNRMVAKFAEGCGGRVYRFMPVQNGMGAPALDYFYCVNGHFVAVETKAPGNNLSPRQLVTAKAIRAAGGMVYVVKNKEDVEWMLDQWSIRYFPVFRVKQVKQENGLVAYVGDTSNDD